MKKNLNPHYDYIFVYKELSLEQLQEMCLELTVWDKETVVSNEFLGGVRLSSGEGIGIFLITSTCKRDAFYLRPLRLMERTRSGHQAGIYSDICHHAHPA